MREFVLTHTEQFNEASLIANVVAMAPTDGYTVGDIKIALSVVEKVGLAGIIQLRETEWAWLKNRLGQQTWTRADEAIVKMIDKIDQAAAVSSNEGA